MVSDVGLIFADASIAEGASGTAGARHDTGDAVLWNQLQKKQTTNSGKRPRSQDRDWRRNR